MSSEQHAPAFFAVITAPVLKNRELSANAKILYASITALSDELGYCWASNQYLADQFGWGERTVSRLVAQLDHLGFIRYVMVLNPDTKKMERHIYIGGAVADGVAKIGDTCQNWRGGVAKNGDQINIDYNIPPYNPPKTQRCNAKRKASEATWMPDRFEAFWAWYRTNVRPENRKGAIRAWDRLRPDDALISRIGKALQAQVRSELWASGKGRPYASTYLNNARWEDAEGLTSPSAPPAEPEVFGWQ